MTNNNDCKNLSKKRTGGYLIKLPVLIIFISGLSFYSCEENPGEFTLGEEFIESQTDINLIDTFTVNLSTVILDTVITSGTGNLLIGNYRDAIFGSILSHSYFQIGIPENFNIENNDIYDSLNLIIRYNKYSFGDTTKIQKILVHQLSENIQVANDDIITSETSFNYSPKPIGSITYTPKPNNSNDTLYIRINDIIGLDLFTKLKNNSEILTDNENFINYFHGLMLAADAAYEGSIIGFSAVEEDVKLILYTSRETITTIKINYEFSLEDITKQFNNIKHDFTSTYLNPLIEQRNALSNIETGGMSFLQGGTGVVIRINFPSLQEILLLERGKIAEAKLFISPLRNSYDNFDLPPELIIYKSDKINRINGTALAASTLSIDNLYHKETSYAFDVTNYINNELSDFYVDPEEGLLITLPTDSQIASFHRLIVDAQNQKPILKIYYLSY